MMSYLVMTWCRGIHVQLLFAVNTKFSAFKFQCDTPEDVQDWVTAIEKLRDSKTVRYILKI